MFTSQTKEKNEYALLNFKRTFRHAGDTEGTQEFQKIVFYKLNQDGTYENGTTLEEIISCAISRLIDLDSRYKFKENKEAIRCLKEAYRFLEMRTEDRKLRGVEGKHEE